MYEIIRDNIEMIKDQILSCYSILYLDPCEFDDFKNEDWRVSDILEFAATICEDYEVKHDTK